MSIKNVERRAKKIPGYLKLFQNGELTKRVEQLQALFSSCRLCPFQCNVDRTKGEKGRCQASSKVKVARAIPHFGEEPVISGSKGSGTIFFSHCNLKCCYCQNYQISHEALGQEYSVEELADMMLALQAKGCHNLNLVSGTHFLPLIARALFLAAARGLLLPVVYNTNGYEEVEVLRLLEGIVDIYLPDVKYAQDAAAVKYSAAENYTRINLQALQEMFRQAGYLVTDEKGMALKGLIVRHLVLPGSQSGTEQVLKSLKKQFGTHISISLMGQYTPGYQAHRFQEISNRTSEKEYSQALKTLEALGFENGWIQQRESLDKEFFPDFTKSNTWN
jgi:putative pyruvate formate lyase activating enzyme